MAIDAALLDYLATEGAKWIRSMRNQLHPGAPGLTAELRQAVSGHFSASTLDLVRLGTLPTIPNPPFYADLATRGIAAPIDFTQMIGLTFDDTIAIATSQRIDNPIGLVFHECVHVAQYQILGVEQFLREYVYGWAANGMSYGAIPLEDDAYTLQERFENGQAFPVEQELGKILQARSA